MRVIDSERMETNMETGIEQNLHANAMMPKPNYKHVIYTQESKQAHNKRETEMKPKTKQTKKNYIYINDMSSKLCENIVFQAKQNKNRNGREWSHYY